MFDESGNELGVLHKRELNANVTVDTVYKRPGYGGKKLTNAGFAELRTIGGGAEHNNYYMKSKPKESRITHDPALDVSNDSSILERSLSLKTLDMSKQKNLMMKNSGVLAKLKERIERQKEQR